MCEREIKHEDDIFHQLTPTQRIFFFIFVFIFIF